MSVITENIVFSFEVLEILPVVSFWQTYFHMLYLFSYTTGRTNRGTNDLVCWLPKMSVLPPSFSIKFFFLIFFRA